MRAKWLGVGIVVAVLGWAGSRLAPQQSLRPAQPAERLEPPEIVALDPPPLPREVADAFRAAESARAEGRLAEAERSFVAVLAAGGPGAVEARRGLAEVLWIEGRFDEVRELVETSWRAASGSSSPAPDEAEALLGFALALAHNPLPIERLRAEVERAAALAPQDDRVWLAQAQLALRTGRFSQAAERLDACERARPDDPAVLRARLDWAVATDHADVVLATLARLRSEEIAPARAQRLRAWLAARDGDTGAERIALEHVVATEPSDLPALARLAELAATSGRADEAARLRRRKAERDDLLHRYRGLFRDAAYPSRAVEMAPLAEALGRRFEAMALWTIALRYDASSVAACAALERLAQDRAMDSAVTRAVGHVSNVPHRLPGNGPEAPIPTFTDAAAAAGLDFIHDPGAHPSGQLPAMSCGGVALLDYDGDGRLDVYCVQAAPFPPEAGRPCADRLFRNLGDGTFEDVTTSSGIAALHGGYGHGAAVGDVDNDGHPDLFVTRWGAYALYHNRGDGTFEDITDTAGLGGDRDWPTSAAFADLDGDGDLDLYVCHYLTWDADHPQSCRSPSTGRPITCDPRHFAALPDHVFRNDGGHFTDATSEAGIVDQDGRGLGVVAADLDDDGRVDLFVANDTSANYLFRNLGGFRFEEVGHVTGVAANAEGGYQAGMGVACGDLDGDGLMDLAVTNFFGESTTYFRNLGAGLFADHTATIGLAGPSRYLLGFGIAIFDANNDGRLDILTVNGHVADERPEVPYAMPMQLLMGGPAGRVSDASSQAGAPFAAEHLGRALAVGDLNEDGKADAVVVAQSEPLVYLQNQTRSGHSLTLELEGVDSNRDAVGARVTITASGRTQVAQRVGGGSFQSASDPRVRFGLGEATRVESVEVHWPSGRVDRYRDFEADHNYPLRENAANGAVRRHVPARRS
jgi:hypothetical protein